MNVLKSYSAALSENVATQNQQSNVLTVESIKSVLKDVVSEEDRRKNFMVFGLPEENDEEIAPKVSEIFSGTWRETTI